MRPVITSSLCAVILLSPQAHVWNDKRRMLLNIQSILRFLVIFSFLLCATWPAHAADIPSADEFPVPAFDDRFSTNWYALVRTVLPPSYSVKGNFDFQKTTNALYRASRRKNVPAKALWGMVLIVTGDSQKTKDAGVQLLRDAAGKGYVPAMMNLGYLYESGKYVHLDRTETFHWFKQAADLGVPEAELLLGGCYGYGLGVAPDPFLATKYYRLSAEQTNYVAMKSLGYHLMDGIGVEKNEAEARYWSLRAAIEGGNRRAMLNLGALDSENPADTNAMQEAVKWIKQSADLGDALAADELSYYYLTGWGGVETNAASYRYWRFKAAFLGATDAQYLMGVAYRTGDGVPKDAENSLIWYGKAAAKNHPRALYDLALHYLEQKTNRASLEMANALMLRAAQIGHREAQFQCALNCWQRDSSQDCEAGREWISKAAENGWPRAEFALFQMCFNGARPSQDCPAFAKDPLEAVKWLRRAADHGNPEAQSVLAVMLIRGTSMKQNKAKAENLLWEAAGHGFGQAQNDLGFAILNGDTASDDLVEAAMWCKLALSYSTDSNVLQHATSNLAHITARLTVEQQQEADRRAHDFQMLPAPPVEPMIKDWGKNPNYQREDGQYGH